MTRILLALSFALCSLMSTGTFAAGEPTQNSIPESAAYLGQNRPGRTPERFPLPIIAGSFAAERIAISGDGRNIYYSELDGYSEMDGKPHTVRLKRLTYTDDKWNAPITLFDSVIAPALSLNGDTLYVQAGVKKAFTSVRNDNAWNPLARVFSQLKIAHYFQATTHGNRYISSVAPDSIGTIDRCVMTLHGDSVSVASLGLPLNGAGMNFDYYISPDESYMILPNSASQLCVSYAKPDGGWTNPKTLGQAINFGLAAWGPYVTADQKYLFYTTGTKLDYSDTYIYWVSISELLDSLRQTNFSPYANAKLSILPASVGKPLTFTIPDNAFVDDDGNATLTYSAMLVDGSPLPEWLHFDSKTRTISGMPSEKVTVSLKITAIDQDGATASANLDIGVI